MRNTCSRIKTKPQSKLVSSNSPAVSSKGEVLGTWLGILGFANRSKWWYTIATLTHPCANRRNLNL